MNDSRNPVRHSNQIPSREAIVIRTQTKPSPLGVSEIDGAPHPMPKDCIQRLPRFYGNNATSIEVHLQMLWDHMKVRGADDEDVYM